VDKIGHSQNFGHRHISSFSVNSVYSVRDKNIVSRPVASLLRDHRDHREGNNFWLDWERDSIKPNPHTLRVKFTLALKGHEVWTKLGILKILDTDISRLSL